jgi:hypothetical protein
MASVNDWRQVRASEKKQEAARIRQMRQFLSSHEARAMFEDHAARLEKQAEELERQAGPD